MKIGEWWLHQHDSHIKYKQFHIIRKHNACEHINNELSNQLIRENRTKEWIEDNWNLTSKKGRHKFKWEAGCLGYTYPSLNIISAIIKCGDQ